MNFKDKILYLLPKRPRFLYNFRQGKFYEFPVCCIIWYCAFAWLPDWVFNPPVDFWRRLGVPNDRDFVPCPYHFKRLTEKEKRSHKIYSLKKFQIELGIHHYDDPVPENMWNRIAEYCVNDVIATKKVFELIKVDIRR